MKRLSKIFLIILSVLMLGGCGAAKLGKEYNKDKLKKAAENVIQNMNDEDYDSVINGMRDDLKKSISKDQLKSAWSKYKGIGKFNSVSKMIFAEKNNVAIVIAIAKYDKSNVQFTLSYDKNMKLVGIYIK